MVFSTLKAARRAGKIKSNLHTGQYTGSISPGHSQGQTLVEPLALLESPDTSTSFFVRPLKKGAVDLPYTPMVSIATG